MTRSPIVFGTVSQLVALPDGSVLVADASHRSVQLLDPSLSKPTLVLDSTSGKQNSYTAGSLLLPFRGDSALWFEKSARVFIVVEPGGKLGRVWAPPGAPLAFGVGATYRTMPVSSGTMGLVYKVAVSPPAIPRPGEGQPEVKRRTIDNSIVARMNYDTRVTDSLGRISTGEASVLLLRYNGVASGSETALIPFYDDAVATTDGSIVIFHASEYRLDWIDPTGARTAAPHLTYAWRPITESDRQRLLDSVNTIRQHSFDSTIAQRRADSVRTGRAPTILATVTSGPDGVTSQRLVPLPAPRPPALATPSEVPDFHEPTARLSVLADADNRVWIRPKSTTPTPGFQVWDIISRAGGVIDRVRVPENRTIAGFAPGLVYLVATDGATATIERVRIE